MDSLTQAVLGGAVGTAVAGKALGRRAALWGAVGGTLPDLDVLAYPFLDTAGELLFHRGLTHGLAFSLVAGPALAWLSIRLARWRARRRGEPPPEARWRAWLALWTAALLTHPLLDVFTVYGTQLLAPFSARPFAIGSVFIIDPLYTVPLALFLAAAVVQRRPRLAAVGLAVGLVYLGWSVAAQTVVERRARAALGDGRQLVTPMPLQTLLWRVVVEEGDRVATYEHSLLGPAWLFERAGSSPRAELPASRGAETLRWFSRGWLVAEHAAADASADAVGVADARFGCGPGGAYVFRWRVAPGGALEQQPFATRATGDAARTLLRRVLHADPVPPPLPCPASQPPTPPSRPAPNRSDPRSFENAPRSPETVPQTTQPPAP